MNCAVLLLKIKYRASFAWPAGYWKYISSFSTGKESVCEGEDYTKNRYIDTFTLSEA